MMSLDARIRADLEGRIRSGEWPPGARIPTEHALMASYGCARMTVNKALSGMAAAGLVDRRKKAGTFVAQPPVRTAVIEIPDIPALIRARGQTHRFDLIDSQIFPAGSARARQAWPGLETRGEVLALEGLHVAQERPFCLEHRLIQLAAAPAAREVDFSTVAPGSWLLGHIPWTQGRHRITACSAGTGASALAVGRGAACLQVERWTWRVGDAVTYVRQLFPGDHYDLVADFAPT
jgi:GntR family histidine utilization transcriptional repressor